VFRIKCADGSFSNREYYSLEEAENAVWNYNIWAIELYNAWHLYPTIVVAEWDL